VEYTIDYRDGVKVVVNPDGLILISQLSPIEPGGDAVCVHPSDVPVLLAILEQAYEASMAITSQRNRVSMEVNHDV
jgi:hypothetical protein